MEQDARLIIVLTEMKEESEKEYTPTLIEKLKELLAEVQALITSLASTTTPT